MRSIAAISGRRRAGGAYSEMNRAAAIPTGIAMTSAMTAISTPSGRIAAMPNWVPLNCDVVKKPKPADLKAGMERATRKIRMLAVITRTRSPAARMVPRKMRSPADTRTTMGRGLSLSGARGSPFLATTAMSGFPF